MNISLLKFKSDIFKFSLKTPKTSLELCAWSNLIRVTQYNEGRNIIYKENIHKIDLDSPNCPL